MPSKSLLSDEIPLVVVGAGAAVGVVAMAFLPPKMEAVLVDAAGTALVLLELALLLEGVPLREGGAVLRARSVGW